MAAQTSIKRSCLLPEVTVSKRWKSEGAWHVEELAVTLAGTTEVAAVMAEDYDPTSMRTMRELETCSKMEAGLMLQEPTSVLDLQTSPGRSCSSTPLSSQPSLSGDEASCSPHSNSSAERYSVNFSQPGSLRSFLLVDQDIASWMDCMEDANGSLTLPEFEEREGQSSGLMLEEVFKSEIFANIDIDFGFELSLDGSEHALFPCFPVSVSLFSDLLGDPELCLLDESKHILIPESFDDAHDSGFSLMSRPYSEIRSGGDLEDEGDGVPTRLVEFQSCDYSGRQGSDNGVQGGASVQGSKSKNCFGSSTGRLGEGHNRSESWGSNREAQVQEAEDSGLQLVHLLLACAEAIENSDFDTARSILSQLRTISNPYGDPMQRIALYFTDALSDRLAKTSDPVPHSPAESELSFQAFYKVLPFVKFSHITANQTIYEAVMRSNKVHVIDLDIQQGLQWPCFIQSLAMRPGGPPHLRISAVGTNAASLHLTKRRLSEFAEALEVPFELTPVITALESLEPAQLHIAPDEDLAINCSQVLHTLSGDQKILMKMLSMFRDLKPNVVTLLEVEANHNGASFIARFVEALHYYCALFDSLEWSLRRDSADRFRVENTAFAAEIKDIVALGANTRRARHVRSETWQALFTKAGFRALPFSSYTVQQAQVLLEIFTSTASQSSSMPYKLSRESAALVLGWQDTPLIGVSAWCC